MKSRAPISPAKKVISDSAEFPNEIVLRGVTILSWFGLREVIAAAIRNVRPTIARESDVSPDMTPKSAAAPGTLPSNYLLVAVLSIPTIIIVGTGVALIFVLITSAASRLNTAQATAENRLAQSLVDTLTKDLNKNVADYSNWDDMYDHFAKPLDPQWAKENLGPYSIAAFGISQMYVLGADGALKYKFSSKSGSKAALDPKSLASLRSYSSAAISLWQPGLIRAYGGVAEVNRRPVLVSVSPIALNSEKRKASGAKPDNVLVFVRELDGPLLNSLGSNFGLNNLRVTRPHSNFVALTNPVGSPSPLSLTWTRSDAGTQFFADAGPSILIVGAAVGLMFITLAFGWAFIIGRIQDVHARAVAAEDTNKSKGLFIANMSHELRTPLNAILGFAELISKEVLGAISVPKYKEYAGDIFSSGQHLLAIVNNLLLFSKLDANQHHVELETLQLLESVSEVVRIMQIEADKKQIPLQIAPISLNVMVDVDRQSLKQILFNLIGNAVKFSNRGRRVRIEVATQANDNMYELQVIDRGCGIPEKTLSEIGNPFVQAESTYSRQYQGTGLGLAICIGLAERMGAKIKISSAENVGTTVSLFLPAHGEAILASSAPIPATRFSSLSLSSKKAASR